MKNRNIIFGAILSALVSFALCQQMQAQDTPDPVPGTVGPFNTADGDHALLSATPASSNVAVGDNAGLSITTGGENTLIGKDTGLNLDTLTGNIYIGVRAGGPVDEVAFIRIGEPTPPVVYDTFIQGIQ